MIDFGIRAMSACLSVGHLDSCAKWYTDELGFQVARDTEFPEYGARIVILEGHGLRLELLEHRNSRQVERPDPPDHGAVRGVSQLTFFVSDLDVVVAHARDRRLAVGMNVSAVPALGISAFFVRDPEGNLIEFAQQM